MSVDSIKIHHENGNFFFNEGDIIFFDVDVPTTKDMYGYKATTQKKMSFLVQKIKRENALGEFHLVLSNSSGDEWLSEQFDYVFKIRRYDYFEHNINKGILCCHPNWNRNLPYMALKANILS